MSNRIQLDSDQTRDGAEVARLREMVRELRERLESVEVCVATLRDTLEKRIAALERSRSGK